MASEHQSILKHIGGTPLVPLVRIAKGLPVQVLVKCEHGRGDPRADRWPRRRVRRGRWHCRHHADGSYAVEGIGGSEAPENLHRDVIDDAERVSDEESFAMVKRLVREEGLLVGGSAGTNVVAALRLAARGGLDGPVVTVLPDSWDRYRAKPWMQEWAP